MDQPEPTLADVIDLIKGVEKSVHKKIDGLIEVVEGMSKGHNQRFSVIEEKLGIDPPRGSEGWKPELLS